MSISKEGLYYEKNNIVCSKYSIIKFIFCFLGEN